MWISCSVMDNMFTSYLSLALTILVIFILPNKTKSFPTSTGLFARQLQNKPNPEALPNDTTGNDLQSSPSNLSDNDIDDDDHMSDLDLARHIRLLIDSSQNNSSLAEAENRDANSEHMTDQELASRLRAQLSHNVQNSSNWVDLNVPQLKNSTDNRNLTVDDDAASILTTLGDAIMKIQISNDARSNEYDQLNQTSDSKLLDQNKTIADLTLLGQIEELLEASHPNQSDTFTQMTQPPPDENKYNIQAPEDSESAYIEVDEITELERLRKVHETADRVRNKLHQLQLEIEQQNTRSKSQVKVYIPIHSVSLHPKSSTTDDDVKANLYSVVGSMLKQQHNVSEDKPGGHQEQHAPRTGTRTQQLPTEGVHTEESTKPLGDERQDQVQHRPISESAQPLDGIVHIDVAVIVAVCVLGVGLSLCWMMICPCLRLCCPALIIHDSYGAFYHKSGYTVDGDLTNTADLNADTESSDDDDDDDNDDDDDRLPEVQVVDFIENDAKHGWSPLIITSREPSPSVVARITSRREVSSATDILKKILT